MNSNVVFKNVVLVYAGQSLSAAVLDMFLISHAERAPVSGAAFISIWGTAF